MDLVLWRHAEAHEAEPGQDDLSRALTPRGEKQAARMAGWLDRQLPDGARILVSPAKRTEQTAQALGRKYKLREELSPNATVEQLLQLVQWPEGKGVILLVGHQPVLGQTIARLLAIHGSECSVKKGAVWWLRHRLRDGVSQTTLVSVQSPDVL
ncbi:MAG: histidine phosphatase family protein [Hylemonella sp.]|uniref:SixA phosphatase family protein n=1 Tax=Hylemonella sp. TaxID=2066020 RepID=UPI0022C61212|nr:histidine phosphatase family protein [Hylemonella sp.]MCZ8251561.1 histidine phosphatase family protein [Hylemonella sp.]